MLLRIGLCLKHYMLVHLKMGLLAMMKYRQATTSLTLEMCVSFSSQTDSSNMRVCLKAIESSEVQVSMCSKCSSSSSHFGHAERIHCFIRFITLLVAVSLLIHFNMNHWTGNYVSFLALPKLCQSTCLATRCSSLEHLFKIHSTIC